MILTPTPAKMPGNNRASKIDWYNNIPRQALKRTTLAWLVYTTFRSFMKTEMEIRAMEPKSKTEEGERSMFGPNHGTRSLTSSIVMAYRRLQRGQGEGFHEVDHLCWKRRCWAVRCVLRCAFSSRGSSQQSAVSGLRRVVNEIIVR